MKIEATHSFLKIFKRRFSDQPKIKEKFFERTRMFAENPIRAFRLGLNLTGLPADGSKRSLFAWLQGLGLTIIESDKMKSHLISILATEENRERLMSVLNRFLDIDISRIPPEKVIFDLEKETITVLSVGHRREIYK